ncbi:MAG: hypothetical protein Kow0042_27970 [Calditrichia bacterium]
MSRPVQNAFIKKKEIQSSSFILFALVYLLALVLSAWASPWQALVYLGLSLGIVLLVWLIIGLTEKIKPEDIFVNKPVTEILFAGVLFIGFEYIRFPSLGFGEKWHPSSILYKEIWLFILPGIFLWLQRYSFPSMGFSLSNWKTNLRIGGGSPWDAWQFPVRCG